MMAKHSKIQALLAAVASVAMLPGCAGETKMDSTPSGDPAATGRYAERECPLPDQTAEIFAKTEDTVFALYTSKAFGNLHKTGGQG